MLSWVSPVRRLLSEASKEVVPHELREALPADRAFWGANWSNSYRGSRWAGVVPNHLYHDIMRTLQDGLLRRGMRVTLAHLPGAPDALMGFVAWEPSEKANVVHFLYTKPTWRKQGLATSLLQAGPGTNFIYTHRTAESDYFRQPQWRVAHVPEPARRKDL